MKNLSSRPICEAGMKLLAKGPNFAVTQDVTKKILVEVEKAIERFAYGKRWKDEMARLARARQPSVPASVQQAPAAPDGTGAQRTPAVPDGPGAQRIPAARESTGAQQAPAAPDGPGAQRTPAAPEGTGAQRTPAAPDGTGAQRTPSPAPGGTQQVPTALAVDQQMLPALSAGTNEVVSATLTIPPRDNQPNLTFRFPDLDKRIPPPTNNQAERTLKQLKDDVLRTFKHHKTDNSNTTKEEISALIGLKKDSSVIIKPSDKCKGFVVLDKSDYVEKAKNILGDRDNYEELKRNPVPRVEALTKRTLKQVASNKLDDNVIHDLTPNHSRIPLFYGLPKDHKPGVPLRPVISACGGPTEKTSCLIERILNQLLKYVPTHLWDTRHFLDQLNEYQQKHTMPSSVIFFSIDVVNLYGSIPIDEAVEAVREKLQVHSADINMFGLTPDDVCTLLDQCLRNNVFRFGEEFYKQRVGVAMGNPCAPPVAILFLDRLEKQALQNWTLKPNLLLRYIDDYGGIWTHGEEALKDFLSYLNSIHPTVKFTMEYSKPDSSVPYLDTLVSVIPIGDKAFLATELYIKPTNSGIVLHFHSAHPSSTKISMARNQFKRALLVSSDKDREEKSVSKMWNLLLSNGYPKHILKRTLREAKIPSTKQGSKKKDADVDGFLTLPYVDEKLSKRVKSVVRKSGMNIRLAWRNNKKLKNVLVNSAISPPPCPGASRGCHCCKCGLAGRCTTKNVVYRISCTLCKDRPAIYIGESKRPIRLRFNEHVRNMLNASPDTPLGDHFREAHGQLSVDRGGDLPLTVEVVYQAVDYPDRKIAESVLIRDLEPTLNERLLSWPVM